MLKRNPSLLSMSLWKTPFNVRSRWNEHTQPEIKLEYNDVAVVIAIDDDGHVAILTKLGLGYFIDTLIVQI